MLWEWLAPVICVLVLALLYLILRTWYLRGPGLKSWLFFRPCKLLKKDTLVPALEGRLAVVRFTFELPGGAKDFGVDYTSGAFVKVRAPGCLPRVSNYSPVDARPGQFDLIIKVWPPTGRKNVSHYLNSLSEGDEVYVSGPSPMPFMHFERRPGKRAGFIAFGVGITEALAIAKAEVLREGETVLLWAVRDRAELFAERELEALKSAGVRVEYHFSREGNRRLDAKRLREVFPWTDGAREEQRFLVVGTKAMKRATYRMLKEAEIPHVRLLRKALGPSPASPGAVANASVSA